MLVLTTPVTRMILMDFIYTLKYIFEKNKIAFFDFFLFYFSFSLFLKFKMKSNGALLVILRTCIRENSILFPS